MVPDVRTFRGLSGDVACRLQLVIDINAQIFANVVTKGFVNTDTESSFFATIPCLVHKVIIFQMLKEIFSTDQGSKLHSASSLRIILLKSFVFSMSNIPDVVSQSDIT